MADDAFGDAEAQADLQVHRCWCGATVVVSGTEVLRRADVHVVLRVVIAVDSDLEPRGSVPGS